MAYHVFLFVMYGGNIVILRPVCILRIYSYWENQGKWSNLIFHLLNPISVSNKTYHLSHFLQACVYVIGFVSICVVFSSCER